jgi:hypothetical protein
MYEHTHIALQVPVSVSTWFDNSDTERSSIGYHDVATRRSKGLLFEAALQNRFHHHQESGVPQRHSMEVPTIQATSCAVAVEPLAARVPRLNSNSGARYLLADAHRQHLYYDDSN